MALGDRPLEDEQERKMTERRAPDDGEKFPALGWQEKPLEREHRISYLQSRVSPRLAVTREKRPVRRERDLLLCAPLTSRLSSERQ